MNFVAIDSYIGLGSLDDPVGLQLVIIFNIGAQPASADLPRVLHPARRIRKVFKDPLGNEFEFASGDLHIRTLHLKCFARSETDAPARCEYLEVTGDNKFCFSRALDDSDDEPIR